MVMSAANINHLGRQLARCVDVAREVEEVRETKARDFGFLVLAAAILDVSAVPRSDVGNAPVPVPGYALDLLTAAKFLCCSQEAIHSSRGMKRLSDCIARFEGAMPKSPDTGEVLTDGPSFLVINEAGELFEPAPLVFEDEED
jgi:hypothetical protein